MFWATQQWGGDDATEAILSMYEKLDRPDIQFLLISGIVISLYNIVDVKKISEKIGLPVLELHMKTRRGLKMQSNTTSKSYESKLAEYSKIETREKITLHTSYDLFIRNEGCTISEATHLLDKLTLQGSVPEPLRISQLLANTLLKAKF